jgi:hypothetical protein
MLPCLKYLLSQCGPASGRTSCFNLSTPPHAVLELITAELSQFVLVFFMVSLSFKRTQLNCRANR